MSPSLKELRAWLRGSEDTPYGEPIRPEARSLQKKRERKAKKKRIISELLEEEMEEVGLTERETKLFKDRRFKVSADGRDALLCFGKHDGMRITDLKVSREGRGYLQWILKEEFPETIKKIIRLYVDEPRMKKR